MTSAFGISHDQAVAKSVFTEAYRTGRKTRTALEAARDAKKLTPEAYGKAKQAQGKFASPVEGEGTRAFAARLGQHIGFHRNAYMIGGAAAKETAAVGAGVAAYQQRKKRKAMEAMGYAAPPDTSMAPVIGALTKGMGMISAFGVDHGPISKADKKSHRGAAAAGGVAGAGAGAAAGLFGGREAGYQHAKHKFAGERKGRAAKIPTYADRALHNRLAFEGIPYIRRGGRIGAAAAGAAGLAGGAYAGHKLARGRDSG